MVSTFPSEREDPGDPGVKMPHSPTNLQPDCFQLQQESSFVQGLSSIATLFQLKQSRQTGRADSPKAKKQGLLQPCRLALMEKNSSFTAGLAALLAIYEISKVPPAMDPRIDSSLLEICGFMWLSSMKIGENVSEVPTSATFLGLPFWYWNAWENIPQVFTFVFLFRGKKKLLEEAFDFILSSLLQQSAATDHLIFILKVRVSKSQGSLQENWTSTNIH